MCVAAGKKCFTVFYFITMKWGDIEQTQTVIPFPQKLTV